MKKGIKIGNRVYVACGINMFGTVVDIYPNSRMARVSFSDNLINVPFACIDSMIFNGLRFVK